MDPFRPNIHFCFLGQLDAYRAFWGIIYFLVWKWVLFNISMELEGLGVGSCRYKNDCVSLLLFLLQFSTNRTHSLPHHHHSQKTKTLSSSKKKKRNSHTHTHTHSLSLSFCSVSLCFHRLQSQKTKTLSFSPKKKKKPISLSHTHTHSLFLSNFDLFLCFSHFLWISLLGLLNVLCFTWIGYKWFFFFFELFYLYCYSFLYLDLIEILGSLGFWK